VLLQLLRMFRRLLSPTQEPLDSAHLAMLPHLHPRPRRCRSVVECLERRVLCLPVRMEVTWTAASIPDEGACRRVRDMSGNQWVVLYYYQYSYVQTLLSFTTRSVVVVGQCEWGGGRGNSPRLVADAGVFRDRNPILLRPEPEKVHPTWYCDQRLGSIRRLWHCCRRSRVPS